MKSPTLLLGSALAAAALAQDSDVVTVTTFVDPTDCPTAANSAGAGAAARTTTVPLEQCSVEPCQSPGPMTTYQTVYSTWCPEGMTAATYTVTEPCPGPPGAPRPTDHIPQGFTVVTESCPVCASPTSGVITKPAPAPAPAPAMPTGAGPAPAPAPASGGAPAPAPAPAQGGGAPAPAAGQGGAAPAPAPAPASGNAAPAPAPAAGNSSIGCSGAGCKPKSMNYANAAAASAVASCGTGLLGIAVLLVLL